MHSVLYTRLFLFHDVFQCLGVGRSSSGLLVFFLDLQVHFLAINVHISGGFDANFHFAVFDAQHLDFDVTAQDNAFFQQIKGTLSAIWYNFCGKTKHAIP